MQVSKMTDFEQAITQVCDECGEVTDTSHYRENENETICEDCWLEFLTRWSKLSKQDWKTMDKPDWDELRHLNSRVSEVTRGIHNFNMMERFGK